MSSLLLPGATHQRKPWTKSQQLLMGRIIFTIFLCGVAAGLGYFANRLLWDAETEIAETQFDSIAVRALSSARGITERRTKGAVTMATIMTFHAPDAGAWPFVALRNGFENISTELVESSDSRVLGVAPFVTPAQLSEFETFAYDYYESKFSNETAISSFGRGVFGINPALGTSDIRYHETDGNTSYGSQNKIFAPILQVNVGDSPYLMMNIHYEERRGTAIDVMIDCAKGRANSGDLTIECGTITDMLVVRNQETEPRPGAVILQPIYPANNSTVLVGLANSGILWEDVLLNAFAEEDSSIECVLSTPTSTHTYSVTNGVVSFKGEGDVHDSSYDSFAQSSVITDGLFSTSSTSYTLTLYPTDAFFRTYRTSNPWIATGAAVGIILFASLMFFIYDFLVQREMSHNHEILDAKRKFVRFISHEIRTPLNAVCMGLKVLRDEIGGSIGKAPSSQDSGGWAPQNHAAHTHTHTHANTHADSHTPSHAHTYSIVPLATPTMETDPPQLGLRSHSLDSETSMLHIPKSSSGDSKFRVASSTVNSCYSDWLAVIEETVENAQGAIDVLYDLLNYDKIESGTLSLELSIIPIWNLIERAAKEFKLQAKKAGVRFELDMSALVDQLGDDLRTSANTPSATSMRVKKMPPTIREQRVMGDTIRIKQVLRNLVSNAIKFTPEEGAVTVAASWVKDQTTGKVITSLHADALSTDATTFTLLSNEVVAYHRSGYVCVKVTDTGAGMTPEQVNSLFQEGVQFNVNQLQAGGGSGLGLYIAKGIAEQHGGSLVVSSHGLGEGTTFTLMLPIYNVPEDELPVSMSQHGMRRTMSISAQDMLQADDDADDDDAVGDEELDKKKTVDDDDGDKAENDDEEANLQKSIKEVTHVAQVRIDVPPEALRVLVVDDAASNRKMLVRLLTKRNHTCDQAKDGREAVDKVLAATDPQQLYDLILMDYEMPEMNGPEAAKHLRAAGCDTFIVGITGNILPEDFSYYKSCGANAVLSKPLHLQELEDLLVEYGITGNRNGHDSVSSVV